MSDLLKQWLTQDVGLGVDAVEKDFANGYAFGQLFKHFNMQPDFEKFENKRVPDSMVNNYTRLQPTFLRLNIPFDTRIANALMREEAGVALRLLYNIKQNLGQVNKDLEKYKSTGRLGRELGASVSPNRTLLEAQQYRTSKQAYDASGARFFEDNMRQRVGSNNQLMESMHLRKFSERQYRMEKEAGQAQAEEVATFTAKRETFRSSLMTKMSSTRSEKGKKLDHDNAVHAALLKHKEELEKEELRVELALAEKARRRKLEELDHAALDVSHGIDTFEINMKRLLKGDDDGDESLKPATTHTPLEHQNKMRAMATPAGKLLEETAGYMSGVKAQRADDVATKREREARRRKMLVEQQAAAAEAERKAQMEALLATLSRQSGEEGRIAARMWQLGQEQEVMRENRLLREAQYAERRDKDWEDTLRREMELHRSLKAQYEAQAQMEMEAYRQAQAQQAEAKAAKRRAACEHMAWQLVMIAERAAEYRQQTGQLVPKHEYRRWVAMFLQNDPQLGEPVVKPEGDGSRPGPDLKLAKLCVEDYLDCMGEFEKDPAIPANDALGKVVAELDNVSRPKVPPGELPQIRELPLRLAVVGAPFSGKTSVAQELSKRYKLKVVDPEVLMAEAIKAAEEHLTAVAAANEAAAAAAAAAEGAAADAAAESPAADAPQPSAKAAIGLQLKQALQDGQSVPDLPLVQLVIAGMEEARSWTPPPELDPKTGKPKVPPKGAKAAAPPQEDVKPQGFVLDGFPRTAEQAVLMERLLTGLNLEAEEAVVAEASRIAPAPPEMLPQLQRPLMSGLDAVVVLGITDEALALKRAMGRRLDPLTGRVYHLEFDPPPNNDPGLSARLKDVQDASNDAVQIAARLAAHTALIKPLDDWLKRFSRLRRPVDGSGPLTEVLASAADVAEGLLRAKGAVASSRAAAESAQKARGAAEKAQEFAELARSHAEAAARELLQAKKAEIQAQALLTDPKSKNPDPAATEVLKAQAAAKCAEQLKVCRGAAGDAAGYAERAQTAAQAAAEAVSRAQESLGDAEVSASAEVDARAAAEEAVKAQQGAAEAATKAEASKRAAEVAVREADKFATVEALAPDAQVELAPAEGEAQSAAPQADGAAQAAKPVAIAADVAAALIQEWRSIESTYLEGLSMGFANLAEQHQLALTHFAVIQDQFKGMLIRPDTRSNLVTKFQTDFNAVDVDARKLKETQAELALRAEELREALWSTCDKKMEDAEAERSKVAADTFVADHNALVAQQYSALAQVELDKFVSTVNFLRGYTAVHYGVKAASGADGDAAAGAAPLVAPDLLSGVIPAELKDKMDEKSKGAMQFPQEVTSLQPKCAPLAQALKVALASAATAVAGLQVMPEDPKKGKKDAGAKKDAGGKAAKGGKGGKVEDPAAAAAEAEAEAAEAAAAAAAAGELAELGSREAALLEARLQLLAERALSAIEGLGTLATRTHDRVGEWVRAKFKAECSAVSALDKVIKAAVLEGKPLPFDLRLQEERVVMDEGRRVHPRPPPLLPPPTVERPPPPSQLSTSHMKMLAITLATMEPEGYMKTGELGEVLLRAAAAGDGLPGAWRAASSVQLLSALREFDPTHTGYADWRELLACLVGAAFPVVLSASCADMADQAEMLSEADKDKDGLLSEYEWHSVELWFQYRAFAPGSEADLESAHASEEDREAAKQEAFDRAAALKQVLWDAFSITTDDGQRLDFRAVLLYLCADRDQFAGIKKAFSVAAGSIASNARATAEQLFKVVYPLGAESGQDIHRSTFDLAAVSEVVSTVFKSRGGKADATPAISAEQLMYSVAGEKLVKHLLGRYQWKDAYTATRLY